MRYLEVSDWSISCAHGVSALRYSQRLQESIHLDFTFRQIQTNENPIYNMSNEENGLQSQTTDSSEALLYSIVQKIATLTEVVQDTRMQLSVNKTPVDDFIQRADLC